MELFPLKCRLPFISKQFIIIQDKDTKINNGKCQSNIFDVLPKCLKIFIY